MTTSARTFRSLLVASTLAAIAVLPLTAQAGTSGARFVDPAGDMAVPSLDVVSGVIRLDASDKARTLTMTATMAGDLTGVPADYDLYTGTRVGTTCYTLATRVRWSGAALAQSYQFVHKAACQMEPTAAELVAFLTEVGKFAVGGEPVAATAGGRTVSVSLPAPDWLTPGSLADFGVVSHTNGVAFSSHFGFAEVGNYDMAGLGRQWRVG